MQPKLTMRGVTTFSNLYAIVLSAKRDTATVDIQHHTTTELGYAKCDLCLDGVVLQRFEFIKICMGENGN